jgi:hypothetical protein
MHKAYLTRYDSDWSLNKRANTPEKKYRYKTEQTNKGWYTKSPGQRQQRPHAIRDSVTQGKIDGKTAESYAR